MKESNYTIIENKSIKYALEKINNFKDNSALILFVIDKNAKLIGSLTDGDIRRGLLNGATLDEPVTTVMQKNFRYLTNLNE